jgi:hypothetical protein
MQNYPSKLTNNPISTTTTETIHTQMTQKLGSRRSARGPKESIDS